MVTCAPIACKHKVSGSVSLPSRGSFHLSLTVLFTIGHQVVFSLGGWAPRLPTRLHVSRGTYRHATATDLRLQDCYLLRSAFPYGSTDRSMMMHAQALPRSLAATWRIDVSFFSCGYLDGSVPRVPPNSLFIQLYVTALLPPGCPIRTSADQCLFAAPRGLSQLVTSFFGS